MHRVKAQNLPAAAPESRLVLHYTGADDDRGGVMSVIRALAGAGRFECVLGVNPGFAQGRVPPLRTLELPSITGETINLRTLWRARVVARAVGTWLREDAARVFHSHSRAGLVVALWLARRGERRVVASVHCYGRQRWFYRWAARQLDGRLYWLSPAMKRYYGIGDGSWTQCVPGCVPPRTGPAVKRTERKPGMLRLGGVGALVGWKGWHLVIEALAMLPREVRVRIKFRHIGAPGGTPAAQRYAAWLQEQTVLRGLTGSVEWLGEQSSADSLLAESDCLVVASDREPFSIAVLEALAAGVPVLAADSGGAGDLLVADRTGWFFRSRDTTDLARALTLLVETDALARASVPPEVVQPYLAPAVAERWAQVYAAL